MAVMAVGSHVKMITLSDLCGITLSLGNSDKKQQWGAKTWQARKGAPVFELQSALVAVGLLEKADGDFGEKTKVALERFQWYGQNMSYALKVVPGAAPLTGMIVPSGVFRSAALPGTCDQGLGCQLLAWKNANLLTTTPLLRVSVKTLGNVRLADSFSALDYPFSAPDEVLLHADFASAPGMLDEEAKKAGVSLLVNQAFRRAGVPVKGAAVKPASHSPHMIGHALDVNIVDGEIVNTTASYKKGAWTAGALAFVKAVKARGYRWGGEFNDPGVDPVHFDDHPAQGGPGYEMPYFFAQHGYHASHPMRVYGHA